MSEKRLRVQPHGWEPLTVAILADSLPLVGAEPACRTTDPSLFEPRQPGEQRVHANDRHARALAVCARCPAAAACRDYATGIRRSQWAGWVIGGELVTAAARDRGAA